MAHVDSVIQLDTFRLDVHLKLALADLFQFLLELAVVDIRELDVWEEVVGDRYVKWRIEDGEFGHVYVHERPEADDVLALLELSLEDARAGEDRLQCSHSEVVMVLWR